MMEFGKTLRLAREAKGMTIEDVAEQTRIMSRTIENLEREIFTDIVAPIYGRGFVKLYCEAVGIDARPMIDEFMEIYNGNRDATIIERPVKPREEPAAVPEPVMERQPAATTADEPLPRPTAPEPTSDLFSANAFHSGSAVEQDYGDITPAKEQPTPEAEPLPKPSVGTNFSRYAAAIDNYVERPDFKLPSIPASVWRMGILAAIALGVLWAVGTGIRALYRCTMPSKEEKASAVSAPAVPESGDAQKPSSPNKAPRTPVRIPPLYMD